MKLSMPADDKASGLAGVPQDQSSVLRTKRAVLVNVEIIRAFVRLRQILSGNADLARKLAELERQYDRQFKAVFDAIRELMRPPEAKSKRRIGFTSWGDGD
ncbi:MAG TPA: hypothetical protein VMR74_05545 [Gammaproteobacteria bacterium]|nr:hypothetical protein [Gammaproteobacteria bacterium]